MNGKLNRFIKRRSTALLLFFIVFWSVLVGRLFWMQVIHHKEYQRSVSNNVQRQSTVSAERGEILDKNNVVLATNISVWRVFISPVDIVDNEQAIFICRNLSELLNVNYDTIYNRALRENRA
ncbi:MAG: hypothetical protein IJD37_00610, partial [Clostridia bacterium]|nr:hypothetical protein [Clostridia bacterium]